jgi:hypothetical protein
MKKPTGLCVISLLIAIVALGIVAVKLMLRAFYILIDQVAGDWYNVGWNAFGVAGVIVLLIGAYIFHVYDADREHVRDMVQKESEAERNRIYFEVIKNETISIGQKQQDKTKEQCAQSVKAL